MAGFCRNCGNPLGDGQVFCAKCGTRVGDSSQPAAGFPVSSPPPPPPATYPAPAQIVPPPTPGASPLAKILIAVVIIFVVFGAFAAGAMIYIGHRVHQKAEELGLTTAHAPNSTERAQLRSIDACALLSKAAVSRAIQMEVVRAESEGGENPGCAYSVNGDAADLTAKHVTSLHKGELNKSQQDMVENFAKTIFQSNGATSGSSPSAHPGEAPVLSFSIDNNNAQLQLRLNKTTLGALGPVGATPIPDLGDEAFDASGAMLFIRKGDKLVRIMYMTCPCGRDDVLPLARTIVGNL